MSANEKCQIRTVDFDPTLGDSVGEQVIPAACMRCIGRALEGSGVQIIDTFDQAVDALREYEGDDFDPENADKWAYTWMTMPGEGSGRHAGAEYGFDIGDQSYELESTTTAEQVWFDCDRD